MKMNFDIFQMEKWVSSKSRWKKWGHLSELLSWNCQKFCPFLIFFVDVSNKSKAAIAVYVYAFESSRFPLLENGFGYYAMTYSLEDISIWR